MPRSMFWLVFVLLACAAEDSAVSIQIPAQSTDIIRASDDMYTSNDIRLPVDSRVLSDVAMVPVDTREVSIDVRLPDDSGVLADAEVIPADIGGGMDDSITSNDTLDALNNPDMYTSGEDIADGSSDLADVVGGGDVSTPGIDSGGTDVPSGDVGPGIEDLPSDPTSAELVYVTPAPYGLALRNPLKGFTTNGNNTNEWATLRHVYIKWNELENDESDTVDKIIAVTEQKFGGLAEQHIKVIPRVYLHWNAEDQKYWPADMTPDDYTSPQFQERLERLIERLGAVWNTDGRVAFVEMGIFGKWGEHHSPAPIPELQALAANAFATAFPNKQVSVRHAWNEFEMHPFGEYWDSFAHYDQQWLHGASIHTLNTETERYKSHYIGGETAYNWGNWTIQPGTDPTDSVTDPIHRAFVVNTARWLHCTQLRWIAGYDAADVAAQVGAEVVQRNLGYRFILEDVGFSPVADDDGLTVTLAVRNEGSAPFYYAWPLEVSLLDPDTKEPIWKSTFESVDIRSWLGGAGWPSPDWIPTSNWPVFYPSETWSDTPAVWAVPAATYQIEENFDVVAPPGTYILAVAILDPAGMVPSVRFATSNYLTGGRHPVGLVAVQAGMGGPLPDGFLMDDPGFDETLYYVP